MGELKVMTGIFVLTIASYALSSLYSNEYTKDRAISDAGRNEGSTPRSFILPATPAVALIQEERVLVVESSPESTLDGTPGVWAGQSDLFLSRFAG